MSEDLQGGTLDLFETTRDRYLKILTPLFFPRKPFEHDIVRFFASLLRISGMEDEGWDPYLESQAVLDDINSLIKEASNADGSASEKSWRLGLILYNQVLEMGAPYEILMNLLRFELKEGYSPNPFYKYFNSKQRKNFKRFGIYPHQKVDLINKLGKRASIATSSIFDEFFRPELRNAIAHADYVLIDDQFRCRGRSPAQAFVISLAELDRIITSAKAFAAAFFILEYEARRSWGTASGRAVPYDRTYKGLMEILADEDGLMNGFKVHWPNNEDSYYRRTDKGSDMVNCHFSPNQENIEMFVGLYAKNRGSFSPLVEKGGAPQYTPVEGSNLEVVWDYEAADTVQPTLPEVDLTKTA